MLSREKNIELEAQELWRALRKDSPPEGLTGSDLLLLLVAQAPELRYDRYVSPHLRESQIARPRGLEPSSMPAPGRHADPHKASPPPRFG